MRLWCWYCHKNVSSEIPNDVIFRAIAICPECINDLPEETDISITRKEVIQMARGDCGGTPKKDGSGKGTGNRPGGGGGGGGRGGRDNSK